MGLPNFFKMFRHLCRAGRRNRASPSISVGGPAPGSQNNYAKDQIDYSRCTGRLPALLPRRRTRELPLQRPRCVDDSITNGAQQTEKFNDFKDQFSGSTLQPAKSVTWNVEDFLGQERADVEQKSNSQAAHAADAARLVGRPRSTRSRASWKRSSSYLASTLSASTTVGLEADYVTSQNPARVRLRGYRAARVLPPPVEPRRPRSAARADC